MASHDVGCTESLNKGKYSAPVPAIGLYVTLATLVCLLLMISDVTSSYRRRKPWIPCRFFKINSFTLTLLAIATKLPVDLTSPMPSVLDQISKLCGTQLICICLVFMTPSTGSMTGSELWANLGTIAMLVLTVIVNICIQMGTGVIFEFMVEHVVTLTLMLFLLLMLCLGAVANGETVRMMTENRKRLLEQGRSDSMVRDLKQCYLFDCITSSELMYYNFTCYAAMGLLCVPCPLILLEAALRSFFVERSWFSGGDVSDYKWSMPILVATQAVTIVIGTLAVGFRWLALTSHTDLKKLSELQKESTQIWRALGPISTQWVVYSLPSIFSRKLFQFLLHILQKLQFVLQKLFHWVDRAVVLAILGAKEHSAWAKRIFFCCTKGKTDKLPQESYNLSRLMSVIREQHSVLPVKSVLKEHWLKGRTSKNMKAWIEKHRAAHSLHLIKLLENNSSSMQLSFADEGRNNCLLVVLLVRINSALTGDSKAIDDSMVLALEETFEIIYFIDNITRTRGINDIYKRKAAKDIWGSRKVNNHWFEEQFINPFLEVFRSCPQDRALDLNLTGFLCEELIHNEVTYVCQIIDGYRRRGPMENLNDQIKNLVASALRSFLFQLPDAIFKYISESPYEEFEERLQLSLKLCCKLNLIESEIPWSPPPDADVVQYLSGTLIRTLCEDQESNSAGDEAASIPSPATSSNSSELV